MTTSVPSAILQQANERSTRLRELVCAPGILVMPGAFDTITALLFQSMGFQALQGTSGGIAAQHGLHDGEYFARDPTIEVYRRMIKVVDVPVNADGVKGFGGSEEIRETVRRMVQVGLSGMNLEDSDYRKPGEPSRLVTLDAQREKIQAVMDAKRSLGSEFFLNARVDHEIVFTRNSTESINLVAQSYGRQHLGPGDEILITHMEHHSNIVPWQMLCDEKGATLRVAPMNDRGELIVEEFQNLRF